MQSNSNPAHAAVGSQLNTGFLTINPGGVNVLHQDSITTHDMSHAEGQLHLIANTPPLPEALNKLCAAVDRQVGNVVSLVLFPDGKEHTLPAIGEAVARYGLFVFSCAAILSPDGKLRATFETYSCIPRSPTPEESALVEQAARLAAIAFQNHSHELDFEGFDPLPNTALAGYSPNEPPPGDRAVIEFLWESKDGCPARRHE
jgi:hypothetical protein